MAGDTLPLAVADGVGGIDEVAHEGEEEAEGVLGHGGVLATLGAADMAGHALILVEALDGRGGEPDIQRLVHQGGGDAVVVAFDLHMRIDIHPRRPPLGIDVGLGRQRLQRGPIHRVELRLPTAREFFEGTAIQPVQTGGDRRVELRQTEEGLMAQPGQDPALHE